MPTESGKELQKLEMAQWPEAGTIPIRRLASPLEKSLLQVYEFTPKTNLKEFIYRGELIYSGPHVGSDIIVAMGDEELPTKLHPANLVWSMDMYGEKGPLHEVLESAVLIGMEQGRRFIPPKNRILKTNLVKALESISKGQGAFEKVGNVAIPEVLGWESEGSLSFEQLVEPIIESINNIYTTERINEGKDISYDGYSLGAKALAVVPNVQTQLTAESLQYRQDRQGQDPLTTLVNIAVQLGIENGIRYSDESTIDKTTFLSNLLKIMS